MSEDEAAGSPQLSLSGFSSLFSISTTTPHPHHHHHHDLPPPSLSLSIGTGGEEHEEEDQVVSSGQQGTTARVRMMKNRESALRSRARKRAYVQELEKEVRRLADDNLRLKRQFKQLKTEIAALVQQQQTNGSPHRRTSYTQF
ncbi:protein FD-like [Lolium rigidum]|uniref:protein FD-like n=1 Tax=Lolium rigidum TaxID=89674 RepID=UPI001F5D5968|nr:protein FD-like [Lolium rigidum]